MTVEINGKVAGSHGMGLCLRANDQGSGETFGRGQDN